ncbi:MAG: hypothetical protein H7326_10490 [Bdellovibrionaceae bacterium]|nr:hypothetical protein [Pseudobdellovibrionaceae bacterium]
MASKPRFELSAKSMSNGNSAGQTGGLSGIHLDSPAGLFVREHSEFFSQYELQFRDPHEGRGGWGASTAQFLSVYALKQWPESRGLESIEPLSISALLEDYWKHAWNGTGHRPSGADLVAQYKGGLTLFEKRSGLVSTFRWNFADIDFALVPTGEKLATHEHLRVLADFDSSSLELAMKQIQNSLRSYNVEDFVAGVRANAHALQELNLVAPKTQQRIAEFLKKPGVLAAKGCGAMGADVILVVYLKKQTADTEFANYVGSKDLSLGLDVQVKE